MDGKFHCSDLAVSAPRTDADIEVSRRQFEELQSGRFVVPRLNLTKAGKLPKLEWLVGPGIGRRVGFVLDVLDVMAGG